MALQGLFSPFLATAPPRMPLPLARNASKVRSTKPVQCITTPVTTIDRDEGSASRRSANYAPSCFWDYNLVKSLSSNYDEKKYVSQVDELKEDIRGLIHAETDVPLARLELLDSVQRLGLNCLFQEDIKQSIDALCKADSGLDDDLHLTALRFRILREHGYSVSQGLAISGCSIPCSGSHMCWK
ncbi:hypothetical protein DCAR_0414676 [Daucus carota subsp. sativus]|uniref:Uncharacterized protein n=1 Tax=Daucus carota subsp. sativus TaxID=79200 RepID=A0A175Y9L1_DAUCS|nr:hypothetical protein DCAR_0414676 [Daucus carota subsp. sativus]